MKGAHSSSCKNVKPEKMKASAGFELMTVWRLWSNQLISM